MKHEPSMKKKPTIEAIISGGMAVAFSAGLSAKSKNVVPANKMSVGNKKTCLVIEKPGQMISRSASELTPYSGFRLSE